MFQLFKSVTPDQQPAPQIILAAMIKKRGAAVLILMSMLGVSACGTPAVSVTVKNPGIVMNATTLPTASTTPVRTLAPATVVVAAVPTDSMPGMSMTSNAPVVVVNGSITPGASPTELVVGYLLFGTPTITPGLSGNGALVTATLAIRSSATTAPTMSGVVASATTVNSPTMTTVTPAVAAAPATTAATSSAASSAASGGVSPTPDASSSLVGDATRGQALFQGAVACSACHNVANANVLVGPSLKGVAVRAQTRKPGYSAAQYINESILFPNAYVVQGFSPGIMPQTFAQTLTPQQIADLVAYLLTLNQ